MPRPRHAQISLEATPYYQCVSRCVRRALICGVDRLRVLAETFAIDSCAYAVMSNHFHLVTRSNAEEAQQWSERELIRRWARLYAVPVLVARYGGGLTESPPEAKAVQAAIPPRPSPTSGSAQKLPKMGLPL